MELPSQSSSPDRRPSGEFQLLVVVDLMIQKRDFLVLEPFYRELDFVREYTNTEERLQALGGKTFYIAYERWIREELSTSSLREQLELLSFVKGCERCFKICLQELIKLGERPITLKYIIDLANLISTVNLNEELTKLAKYLFGQLIYSDKVEQNDQHLSTLSIINVISNYYIGRREFKHLEIVISWIMKHGNGFFPESAIQTIKFLARIVDAYPPIEVVSYARGIMTEELRKYVEGVRFANTEVKELLLS